jgi:hypothetical protein
MATSRRTQAAASGADKRPATAPPTGARALPRERIAERAYQIWQASGCPAGRDQENWLQAERELGATAPAARAAAR